MRTAKGLVVLLGTMLTLCGTLAHAANAWEGTIQAYESQDASNPPPSGSIVVTGSSSIVKWTTMASDLYPLDLIQRGFGGSMTSDLDYFLERIVLKYNPRAVVIYEGDNDLNAGVTPQAASATMGGILARISARLPDARVYVISVKIGPARLGLSAQIKQLNQLNAALCAADARYTYIDVMNSLMYSDGTPIAAYFDTDGVHLNAAGYRVWSYVIRNVLVPQQQRPLPTDAAAPTTPGNLAASVAGATQVNLRWDAASDAGSGLAGYRIYRDGQAIATTTATTYSDYGVAANSYYSYALSAFDRAVPTANESPRTAAVFATTPGQGAAPAVTLTATPAAIYTGASSALSWNASNATSCTASGAWSGARPASGTLPISPAATATFALSCTGPGGTGSGSVTITVSDPPVVTPPPPAPPPAPTPAPAPTVTLAAASGTVTIGDDATLTWSSTNAVACTRTGAWAGSAAPSGSATVTPAATSDYTITCSGSGGSISASTRVTVVPQPTVTLSASAATVASGGTVSLQWASANAASCTASGGWSGSRPLSGNETTPAIMGSSAYDLTCRGPYGGTARASIEVSVAAAPEATTTVSAPATPPSSGTPAANASGGGGSFDFGALAALIGLLARAGNARRPRALH